VIAITIDNKKVVFMILFLLVRPNGLRLDAV
jgi:hypothetical protein